MRKVPTPTRPKVDRAVLHACWVQYAETALPQKITDEDLALAGEAFAGGARALYECLTRMQALADRRGDPPLDLARVGRLLGWEDDPPIN